MQVRINTTAVCASRRVGILKYKPEIYRPIESYCGSPLSLVLVI